MCGSPEQWWKWRKIGCFIMGCRKMFTGLRECEYEQMHCISENCFSSTTPFQCYILSIYSYIIIL